MPSTQTLNRKFIIREIKDYVFITLGLTLFAYAFTIFLLPYKIVTGGVTGAAALILYAFGVKIELSYLVINIALLLVALYVLGFRFMMKTIYAIFALYFLLIVAQMSVPQDPVTHLPIALMGKDQAFMSLVVGCCLTGTSLAIVFLNNGSTGGTDIVAACINKYHNISLGRVLLLVDILIVGSCMFFPQFGTPVERMYKVIFGLCTIVIETSMLDFVFNKQRQSVQFLIFSKKYKEIGAAIADVTDRSMTILDGHGWYTGHEMKVICLLAKKYESQTIFRLIKQIDPNAFVSQSSVIGVYGEGFDAIKVRLPKDKSKIAIPPGHGDE